MGHTQGVELGAGSLRLGQRPRLGAGDQDQGGGGRVAERRDRLGVTALLRNHSRKWPQAGGAGAVADECRPGRREGQQAQGVPGGRGVEDDVVEPGGHLGIGEQCGELVERGDLHGARTRELFLHSAHGAVGEHPSVGADDPLPVCRRRGFGVHVQCRQALYLTHLGGRGADVLTEDLGQVRGRVGADQQH